MSELDQPSGRSPLTPDSGDFTSLIELVRAAAHRAALRNRITDYEEDLVQTAMLEICADGGRRGRFADEEETERRVVRLAAREANRRRSERSFRRQQTPAIRDLVARSPRTIHKAPINVPPAKPPKRKGIPTLCLRIVRLASGTGHEVEMALHVRAAATVVARDTKALLPRQYRAFSLAYVHEKPIDEVALLLGTTPGAATQRLHAIANKLERALVESLAPDLDAASMGMRAEQSDQAAKTNQRVLSAYRETACVEVLETLARFLAIK